MIDAAALVDLLLEAEVPLLVAFGPKLPKEGYAVAPGENAFKSNNLLFTMLLNRLGTDSPVDPSKVDLPDLVNSMISSGYTFVLRPVEGGVYVYSQSDDPVDAANLRHFNLKPDSVVNYGHDFPRPTQPVRLSQLTRGEAPSKSRSEVMAFGGVENPPGGTYVKTTHISTATLQKGIENGLRYVIRHPGARKIVFVTPDIGRGNNFKPEEIRAVRERFNLRATTPVDWYIGNVNPQAKGQSTFGEIMKMT